MKTYHIVIDIDESKRFLEELHKLNVVPNTTVITHDSSGKGWFDVILDLSKHELLYIRLTFNTGEIRLIDDWAEDEDLPYFNSGLLS